MANDAQDHNMVSIRQLLLAAFTPEDLHRFCHDRPTFRPVVNRFGPGHGLDDMVDELITYCENFLLFPELLAELKQHNPRQYSYFIELVPSKDKPSPPTSQIVTISHPISLQLVRVPAGEFQMGSVMARDKQARDSELPPHPVHVPEFHIGKYPVTNTQYLTFVWATGHRLPKHWEEEVLPEGKYNHPIVNISWKDALAFCSWLAQKSEQPFRLPTEAEWEKAARGTDGRIYPWGDDPLTEDRCNFNSNAGDTTMTGHYSPQGDSPYGCADMAGNVLEWCQSLVRPYPYRASDGREAHGQTASACCAAGRSIVVRDAFAAPTAAGGIQITVGFGPRNARKRRKARNVSLGSCGTNDLVFVSGTYLWYNLGEGLDQEIGSRCSGFRSERAVMLHVLPPVEFRLTNHARFEMECRGISEAETAQVLSAPEQADLVRPGRVVTAYRR